MDALVPVEQKQVLFYDDQITAVIVQRAEAQQVYVPLRPLCGFLGVAWTAQRQRILRDPVLSEVMTPVIVTITGSGQQVETLCLPLDYLNGWLFGINATRVKDEVRNRLIRYQRECYKVLAEAFQEGRLTADPDFDALLKLDTPEVQAYRMAMAVAKLARQQILLRNRVEDHEQRLEQIEAELGRPERFVSSSQAMEISQAVKAVAVALGQRSGRNEFGGVYGELYRQFEVTSYKQMPASRFEKAMTFLTDWHQSLIGDSPF